MVLLRSILGLACVALVGCTASAQAKREAVDFGKQEFDVNCASCHGVSGKGNGVLNVLLTKGPPDLTQLAKRNGGVFPMERLYRIVDGQDVPSHASREMPVWGLDYKIQAAEHYIDAPYNPETYVRGRILALLEYINRLQVK